MGAEEARASLHVLMVASEEYVPEDSPLSGVFERDQALAVRDLGHRVGMLSVRLEVAPLWRVRNAVARLRGRGIDRPARRSLLASVVAALRRPVVSVGDEDGITVVRAVATPLGFVGSAGWLRSWGGAAATAYARYIAACGRPDIVHVHNALPGGDFVRRYLAQDVPFVLTEHSTRYAREVLDRSLTDAARASYAAAAQVIAVSTCLCRLLRDLSLTHGCVVVPNVVAGLDDLAPAALLPPPPPFRFVNIGSLYDHKGQRELIRAVARLGPDVEIDIVGDGPLRPELEREIDKFHLHNRVRLLGQLPRAEIPSVLRDSHALVVASRHETFGVAVIEALAAGRPVVATRSGGPESIIDESNGLLVDGTTPDDLEGGMRLLMERYTAYEPRALHEACRLLYSPKAVALQLHDIYLYAVGGNNIAGASDP